MTGCSNTPPRLTTQTETAAWGLGLFYHHFCRDQDKRPPCDARGGRFLIGHAVTQPGRGGGITCAAGQPARTARPAGWGA
ncbi:MAG: hypothetical protein U0350_20485 [Caldilineaceae bacterium]